MLKLQSRCVLRPRAAYAPPAVTLAAVQRRRLLTLAIETSCDDTSVAVLETCDENAPSATPIRTQALLHFHRGVSARNKAHGGIHPIVATESHQENLARLIQDAVQHLPIGNSGWRRIPDFISVTRGPGMRSCLNTGLDTAKGLSTAWQIPLVGIHHMQAHALTPRLVSALEKPSTPSGSSASESSLPAFPFLSLLASGGHTLLLHSKDLCDHTILASSVDVAIGSVLDKMARDILPQEILERHREDETVIYGRLLEEFAFPDVDNHIKANPPTTAAAAAMSSDPYDYTPPRTRADIRNPRPSQYGWALPIPFGEKRRHMEFSFSGLGSSVGRICGVEDSPRKSPMSIDERRHLAREAQRVCFEHLASRVRWALEDLSPPPDPPSPTTSPSSNDSAGVNTVVLSGGVASNSFLRHLLPRYIASAGPPPRPDGDRQPRVSSGDGDRRAARSAREIEWVCPPVSLCTDNAAMIAWAGVEMWRAGWVSELRVRSRKTWSLDPEAADGGVLGVGGWRKRRVEEEG